MTNKNIITYGCRLNIYESEVIQKHMDEAGLKNYILFNSCSVTNEAKKKVINDIKKAKKISPQKKIIVTGCASQIDSEFFNNMTEVNHVIGNKEKMELNTYLSLKNSQIKNKISDIMQLKSIAPQFIEIFNNHSRAFIQIQNGCDHRCTFCTIPFGRGNSRSLPIEKIIEQINILNEKGFNEIILTGVDLTSYGPDLGKNINLGVLVQNILNKNKNLKRLRLSSIDSIEIDDLLFDIISSEKKIMPHFHLSMQSGDNMILKRMKRRHQREHAIDFCNKLKSVRPEVIFGADLIAGFPTETEEMFHNTLKIIDECDLTLLHVFPFSPMQKTPAAKMPQVPRNIVKERAKILREKGQLKIKNKFKDTVGQKLNVLTEKDSFGYSENYLKVKITGNQKVDEGQIIPVYITGYSPSYLKATI